MLYLCLWEAAKLYDWYSWINYLGSDPGSTIFWLCLNRWLSHLNFNFLICRMGIITAYDSSGCYNELVINESVLNNVYRRHSNIARAIKEQTSKVGSKSLHSSGSTDKIPAQPLTSQHRPGSRLRRGPGARANPILKNAPLSLLMGKVGEGRETEHRGGGGRREPPAPTQSWTVH